VAVVWNVPVACNRATADYMISSPLLSQRPGDPRVTPAPVAAPSVSAA
jgi:methylglyoxal synthase